MIKKILMVVGILICSQQMFAGATPWYDFEMIDGVPVLDIKISGVPAKAVLSTGSNTVFVNVDSLKAKGIEYKKGKKVYVRGRYGKSEKVNSVKGIDLEVLGLKFDPGSLGPSFGESSYDISLGYSFFKSYIFQIATHTNDTLGMIVISELEDGKKLRLKLDTSLETGILLKHSAVKKKGWLDKYPLKTIKGDDFHKAIVLPELKLGPAPLADVMVAFPGQPTDENLSEETDAPRTKTKIKRNKSYEGSLGYDTLKHFVVTLDAKKGKMHITW